MIRKDRGQSTPQNEKKDSVDREILIDYDSMWDYEFPDGAMRPNVADVEGVLKELEKKLEELPPKESIQGKPETFTEQQFIDPLLKVLGWEPSSSQEFHYRKQYEIKGVSTKWEDYALLAGKHPKIFIEAKSIYDTNILKHKSEIIQYMDEFNLHNKEGFVVYLGILTNFRETYFFHYGDKDPFLALFSKDLVAPKLVDWLSPEGVERGTVFAIYRENLKQPLDILFLRDLKKWRLFIANGFLRRDPSLSKADLKAASQKLLDRMILIRILESKNVLPSEWIRRLYNQWLDETNGFNRSFSWVLRNSFRSFESLYNTELFKENLCDSLEIDDCFIEELIKVKGYDPEIAKQCATANPTFDDKGIYGYNFATLTLDIIGSVYERYLAHDLVIADGKVKIEETAELRKKEGAYYTPQYVVDYIVGNTVKPKVESVLNESLGLLGKHKFKEAHDKISEISRIKVLDPASGSGSFLIKAFDEFAKAYDNYNALYLEREGEWYRKNGGIIAIREHEVKDVGTRILIDNIHGVDLDAQAVELTKLNLWIRAISRYPDLYRHKRKKVEKKELPMLEFNIKCGNSLISGIADAKELGESKDKLARLVGIRTEAKEIILSRSPEHAKSTKDANHDELKKRLVALVEEDRATRTEMNAKLNAKLQRREENGKPAGYFEDVEAERPFNWEVEYPEVFDLSKDEGERGFDCVVGNPPYVDIYTIPEYIREYFNNENQHAYKKYDLYTLFIGLAMDRTKKGALFGYIVPDKFMFSPYADKIRADIVTNYKIQKLIDLRDISVFSDATVSNIIFIFNKEPTGEKDHLVIVMTVNAPPNGIEPLI
ncbi:MAG: N-6 DNA methylase [Euryarchaeota archaeon]|nr:N-6 DNA methylase [Euryarchaeota archaeon]